MTLARDVGSGPRCHRTVSGRAATRTKLVGGLDFPKLGQGMFGLAFRLFPICRSITGQGFLKSIEILQEEVPITLHRLPTGTRVLDWLIPKEWNIRDAWIKEPSGRKIVDFRDSNLHVVNYSVPIRVRLPLSELKLHLHTLPDRPDWIPYRTSYYKEDWGFCLAHNKAEALEDGEYEVCIDSSLEDGGLHYGECVLPGATADEVLLSCHCCHPSLANDNLSGMALAAFLGKILGAAARRFTYRILFVPGTIGAIAWLAANEAGVARVRHGLVIACVGDRGPFTYKRSRRGNAEIDRAVAHILRHSAQPHGLQDFSPYGYDERQYCSPGFDLPVGSLTRTPHGRYAEYHTSADDLSLIDPDALSGSLEVYLHVLDVLEGNRRYRNTQPKGEPHLGRRGLYGALGGHSDPGAAQLAMLWVLNLADGSRSLLDIADRAGQPFSLIEETALLLAEHGLIEACG